MAFYPSPNTVIVREGSPPPNAGGGRRPSGQSSLNHMSWTSSGRSA